MSSFLLSQALAAVALACGAISFQSRRRRSILLWLFGTGAFNAAHFFILGRSAAGTLYLVIAARCLAAAFSVNRKTMYLFFGLILIGFAFSYRSPIEVLGLFGALSATYGSFQRAEPRLRVFHMLSNASWMIHHIVVGTPVAAVTEATFLTSNVIGYWRFHVGGESTPPGEGCPADEGSG